jgi:hypothetical protein
VTAPVLSTATPFGRYYIHPNRPKQVPSITNIKGIKGIEGLKWWAAKEAGNYAADNIAKLAMLSRDEIFTLVKGAPFAKTSAKSEASDVGDVVHDWIDSYIKGIPPTEAMLAAPVKAWPDGNVTPLQPSGARTARNMWRQFVWWVKAYEPQFTGSEFTVWSDKYEYAGTADWMANIRGMHVLGDTKTGKAVYDDFRYQLAALAFADFILDASGNEQPIPRFDAYGILHVRPMGAELVRFKNEAVEDAFKAFVAMKVVFEDDIKWKGKTQMLGTKLHAPKTEASVADNSN